MPRTVSTGPGCDTVLVSSSEASLQNQRRHPRRSRKSPGGEPLLLLALARGTGRGLSSGGVRSLAKGVEQRLSPDPEQNQMRCLLSWQRSPRPLCLQHFGGYAAAGLVPLPAGRSGEWASASIREGHGDKAEELIGLERLLHE